MTRVRGSLSRALEGVGQAVGETIAIVGMDVEGSPAGVVERELAAVRAVTHLVEAINKGRAVGRAEVFFFPPPPPPAGDILAVDIVIGTGAEGVQAQAVAG